MSSWLALRIVAPLGMLAWLATLVANRTVVSFAMLAPLAVTSFPYVFALAIAWGKREFAGAMLVASVVALAAQLYVQIELYLTPPDGQKGIIVMFLVFAQVFAVALAATCAEAVESHRRHKAERAGRTIDGPG